MSNEGADRWSPFDVIGHLIHGEETNWIPGAKIILAHDEAQAFEPFDRFAMVEKSRGKSLGELLDTFGQWRRRNLEALAGMKLTPELLERRAAHPDLGAVTLSQLLAMWLAHDVSHIGQTVRVMGKQYREAVGPWHAYLPLLRR